MYNQLRRWQLRRHGLLVTPLGKDDTNRCAILKFATKQQRRFISDDVSPLMIVVAIFSLFCDVFVAAKA